MGRVAGCVLWVLVLLGTGGCSATRPSAKPPAVAASPTRHVLPNGIPLIVQEHRGSELVALQLWVRAGSRDESASELGLAHYLEHMLFRGTTSRPTGFVERDVESVGGAINAGTSWDFTYYYVTLPASRVTQGLELLADIAMNAALDAAVLDKEKDVVLEEMRLGQDSPRRVLGRTLYAQLFEGHPYGREILGTPELIRGLTRDTLLAFYRHHYAPEAFAVVVVGPIDQEQVVTTARTTFGRLPRGGTSRLPLAAPSPFRPRREEIVRPGGHAYLGLAWPATRLDHADTPALDLLVSILGGQRSSRLVQSLREQRGLVVTVDAGFSALAAAGAVVVTAQVDPKNLQAAEDQVLAEVKRIRDAGVTPAELRRAITAAEAAYEFRTETAQGRAVALGRAETTWTIEDELAYVSRLRTVSAEQVQSVARRYLDLGQYTMLALVPSRTRSIP
jgi:zinc protease